MRVQAEAFQLCRKRRQIHHGEHRDSAMGLGPNTTNRPLDHGQVRSQCGLSSFPQTHSYRKRRLEDEDQSRRAAWVCPALLATKFLATPCTRNMAICVGILAATRDQCKTLIQQRFVASSLSSLVTGSVSEHVGHFMESQGRRRRSPGIGQAVEETPNRICVLPLNSQAHRLPPKKTESRRRGWLGGIVETWQVSVQDLVA